MECLMAASKEHAWAAQTASQTAAPKVPMWEKVLVERMAAPKVPMWEKVSAERMARLKAVCLAVELEEWQAAWKAGYWACSWGLPKAATKGACLVDEMVDPREG